MTWEIVLFIAAATHGVILSLLFISNRSSTRKRFLGIYLLAFSITILHYSNFWTQAYKLSFTLQWVCAISNWIMPFAFYYYIKEDAKLSRLPYHLIPALAFTTYWITAFYIRIPPDYFPILGQIITGIKIVLFTGYGVTIVRTMDFNQVNRLFFISYASFIVGQVAYSASLYFGFYTLRLDYIICAGFVILTYGITWFGEYGFLKEKVKPKYSSSSLTKEDGDYLVQKINSVLEQNKYYKDPDFNLSSFAEKIGVPKYRISQALNAFSEKSFSELVNEFRVEEAKEKLQLESCRHLKLEAIGEEAGFRNKVSFYKNFKKIVGSSPGEFREEHLQKSA